MKLRIFFIVLKKKNLPLAIPSKAKKASRIEAKLKRMSIAAQPIERRECC